MSRTQFIWVLLGLITLMSGCKMCAHPYDYCGPTYTHGPGGCSANAPRAGSILSGSAMAGPVRPASTISIGDDILANPEPQTTGPFSGDPLSPTPTAVEGPSVMEGPSVIEEPTMIEGPVLLQDGPVISQPTPVTAPAASSSSGDSSGWRVSSRRGQRL